MNEGAFAFLDCLGFKGIWSAGADRVIAKLNAVEQAMNQRVADIRNAAPDWFPTIQFTFLSDTIVIAVHTPNAARANDIGKGALIRIAVNLSLAVAKEFINGEIPRALRGCITYGQFLTAGNYIVGPAVDEAATAERFAEGAFIWLLPEAGRLHDVSVEANLDQLRRNAEINVADASFSDLRLIGEKATADLYERLPQDVRKALGDLLRDVLLKNGDLLMLRNYPVLMKGLGPVRCHVANPCTQFSVLELESKQVIQKYRDAMQSTDLSVVLKRQQTEIMLQNALQRMSYYMEGLAQLRKRFP